MRWPKVEQLSGIMVLLFVFLMLSVLAAKFLTYYAVVSGNFIEANPSVAANIGIYGLEVALFGNIPFLMFVFGLPIVGYYGCSKFAFPRMINGRSCKVLGAMVVVGVLASGLVWFGIDALHDMLMVLSNGEVGLLV